MTSQHGANASGGTTRSHASKKRLIFWLALTLLGICHVGLVDHFVPSRTVFGSNPLSGMDYDRHAGEVFRVAGALQHWGRSWLYDTQLDAGRPAGAIGDLGSKAWQLWVFALVRLGVSKAIAFNCFVWLWMLVSPLFVYAAARNFGFPVKTSLVSAAMTSTLWFFDSYLHWVWFSGMIAWAGAACMAVLALGLFHRSLSKPRRFTAWICAVTVALGTLVHPGMLLAVLLPMVAMYGFAYRSLGMWQRLVPVAVLLVTLAVNGYWLHNAARHWGSFDVVPSDVSAGFSPFWCDVLDVRCADSNAGGIGTRAGFRFLVLFLAAAGLYASRRAFRASWLALLIAIASLYAIAYAGGHVPSLRPLNPYQQLVPAMLLSTIPAAVFVVRLAELRVLSQSSRVVCALVVVCGIALSRQLVATQVAYFLPEWVPEPHIFPDGARSPVSKFGYLWPANLPSAVRFGVPHDRFTDAGAESAVRWLVEHAPSGARIWVDDATIANRLAWSTTFEVVRGPRDSGRALAPAEISEYLRSFAVEWVVSARAELRRHGGVLARVGTFSGKQVYKSSAPVDRILSGGGTVRASSNWIEVHGSSVRETLVLAYHWHPALRCRPECHVERSQVRADRAGFIAVPAPHPSDLVVWNSYELSAPE